ncbi:hypothetical protein HR12_37575, partial [Microbacterium sp. SUBG005]
RRRAPVVAGSARAPPDVEAEVGRDVRRLLERRTAASLIVPSAGHALVQTIGPSGRLRGVLAVGGPEPLDPAGRDLVASVVALASIALEQQRGLQSALRGVRAGVIDLLVEGHGDTARRVAESALGGLPVEPYLVGIVRGAGALPGLPTSSTSFRAIPRACSRPSAATTSSCSRPTGRPRRSRRSPSGAASTSEPPATTRATTSPRTCAAP